MSWAHELGSSSDALGSGLFSGVVSPMCVALGHRRCFRFALAHCWVYQSPSSEAGGGGGCSRVVGCLPLGGLRARALRSEATSQVARHVVFPWQGASSPKLGALAPTICGCSQWRACVWARLFRCWFTRIVLVGGMPIWTRPWASNCGDLWCVCVWGLLFCCVMG